MAERSRRRSAGNTRSTCGRAVRPGIAALVTGGCAVVVGFQIALTLGAPLGAAALGGSDPGRLSDRLRIVTALSAVFWSAAGLLALSRGSRTGVPIPQGFLCWGTWALAAVLGMGALMNFASPSNWERFGWGPFALTMCALCIVLARSGLHPPLTGWADDYR